MRNIILLVFSLIYGLSWSQSIDIIKYRINIAVNDDNDIIQGSTWIFVDFLEGCAQFELDFASKSEGKGMLVKELVEYPSLEADPKRVKFSHRDNKLIILPSNTEMGQHIFKVDYEGIPEDGLVIGVNKHGKRTFFGDNWPNRAHLWFPCVDHPSDKALVEYEISHPKHYTCVANGNADPNVKKLDNIHQTTYTSKHPLPTKVMVFGLADFISDTLNDPSGIQHVNFIYSDDRKAGVKDMKVASDPLNFYIDKVAPYPFERLYNVQSTTRFGGMENAGCIFYDENAVTGEESMEALIAHEIAHQWFGNSASESDWKHLWLSEGFATYFTDLHFEHKYGIAAMNERLEKERARVIGFSYRTQTPVIDTVSTDLMYLLNPNSYQKGAWFLHMLRRKVGDDFFWKGIQNYYQTYKYSNATSNDFKVIMESISNQNLTTFFNQWLKRGNHPKLITKEVEINNRKMLIVQQAQQELFEFALEVELVDSTGKKKVITMEVNDRTEMFDLELDGPYELSKIDPNVNLLFEVMSGDE